MAVGSPAETPAIRVEPLSPAVGLWIDGIDLLRLDSGAAAMIEDLWQLGGALLFRAQSLPAEAAGKLAAVLGKGPVPESGEGDRTATVTGAWAMPGSALAVPPKALVFAAADAAPGLMLAGMEAAADAMRMEDPDFLSQIAGARAPHVTGGPVHPVLHRHPLSGEVCFYPPPPAQAGFPGAAALADYVGQERFCCMLEWQAGDVLAIDPRTVLCRWSSGRDEAMSAILVPGAAPLLETRGAFGDWE
jgi:hypothetical protein